MHAKNYTRKFLRQIGKTADLQKFDPPSWIRHLGSAILDFTTFLKGQQITEINPKSRFSGDEIQ